MLIVRRFKVRKEERGLLFRDRVFVRVLGPGAHWVFDPLRKVRVDVLSVRDVWLKHKDLDVLAKSGALRGEAEVLNLADHERALVFVDGRFEAVLKPGLYALWKVFHDVRVEVLDATKVRFVSEKLHAVLGNPTAGSALDVFTVEADHVGLFYRDGKHEATLAPDTYAFWKGVGKFRLAIVDLREQVLDIAGQEIMTADKVTLRMNAVVTFRVADALKATSTVEDPKQALYRDAQLALRAVVGTKELDALLQSKDGVAENLANLVRSRAAAFGVEVVSLGIRDVILPGEMKELLNKVTEAKKAAEASLITRREETAAMRSQANTAKILEGNPTLMRLRELEVLEKVTAKAKLNLVLGDKGLADTVVKIV
jgi:regulator of protease activity HflC (stomatin/prohibitin superfamily)